MKAKQIKQEGHQPKKRKKYVEERFDDLGDDLSGLGENLQFLSAEYLPEYIDSSDDDQDEQFVSGMWWGFSNDEDQEFPPNVYRASTLDAAIELLSQNGDGLDICEMCGGAARTLKIATRRRLKTGRNFDLITGCDLGDPRMQREFKKYLENHQVLLVTMAPRCRTWG